MSFFDQFIQSLWEKERVDVMHRRAQRAEADRDKLGAELVKTRELLAQTGAERQERQREIINELVERGRQDGKVIGRMRSTLERVERALRPISPKYMALFELPNGSVFETESGIRAVKSQYKYSYGGIQVVLLASGEFGHFGGTGDDCVEKHNSTMVHLLEVP